MGFLEFWSEVAGEKHYMRGGRPGDFPDFDNKYIPGGALNLFDPFGWSRSIPKESKEKRLLAEVRMPLPHYYHPLFLLLTLSLSSPPQINNGRLAMIGIMGFCAESELEGSVPALKGIISHYDGEVMAPLAAGHGLVHMDGLF